MHGNAITDKGGQAVGQADVQQFNGQVRPFLPDLAQFLPGTLLFVFHIGLAVTPATLFRVPPLEAWRPVLNQPLAKLRSLPPCIRQETNGTYIDG